MVSEWEICELGGLAEVAAGAIAIGPFGSRMKADCYVSEGVAVIRGANLGHGRALVGDFVYITPEKAKELGNANLKPSDLVFPHRGSIGETGIVPADGKGYVLSTSLMKVTLNNELADPNYVYYFFRTPAGRAELLKNASQVGTPGIATPLKSLRECLVPCPPIQQQKRVAGFLQVLDERIDNIRQTNATLEAIAQALFKSWFVDFDPVRAKAEGLEPEGMDAATAALFPSEFEDSELGPIPRSWSIEGLGKISKNVREQAKPECLDPSTPYIGLEHMPKKSIALTDQGSSEGLASGKFWYRTNDILFGKLRPYFHKVGIAIGAGVCSTDILVVRPVSPEWLGYAAMQFSSDAVVSYATQLSNGAKMPRTNWSDLAKFRVALPPANIVGAFDNVVRPMISKIHANIAVGTNLAELRDTLLPRLISGKHRLPEAEVAVEDLSA